MKYSSDLISDIVPTIVGIAMVAGIVFLGVVSTQTKALPAEENSSDNASKTVEKTTVTKDITVSETIKYDTKTIKDSDLEYGKTAIKQKGQNGLKVHYYKVTYEDGVEINREKISTKIQREPVDEIIAEGTKIIWRCIDITSYDRNPYNDNLCTSSTGESRYLSDRQAEALDSTYRAGKSGAWYYNNK